MYKSMIEIESVFQAELGMAPETYPNDESAVMLSWYLDHSQRYAMFQPNEEGVSFAVMCYKALAFLSEKGFNSVDVVPSLLTELLSSDNVHRVLGVLDFSEKPYSSIDEPIIYEPTISLFAPCYKAEFLEALPSKKAKRCRNILIERIEYMRGVEGDTFTESIESGVLYPARKILYDRYFDEGEQLLVEELLRCLQADKQVQFEIKELDLRPFQKAGGFYDLDDSCRYQINYKGKLLTADLSSNKDGIQGFKVYGQGMDLNHSVLLVMDILQVWQIKPK